MRTVSGCTWTGIHRITEQITTLGDSREENQKIRFSLKLDVSGATNGHLVYVQIQLCPPVEKVLQLHVN